MSIITLTDDGYQDENGTGYDRTTDICKLAYVDDPFQFVKPSDMEAASARGSAVHRLTSNEAEAGDEEWADWADGWHNFVADTGYQELASELRVYSETYRTAGTLDSFGILKTKGKATVAEKKTTAGIPLTTGIQLAGYRGMLNYMIADKVKEVLDLLPPRKFMISDRIIVWLRPTFIRGYKLISEGDQILIHGKRQVLLSPTDWQTFIGLLMVKRWRQRFLKPTKEKQNVSIQRNNMGQPGSREIEEFKWGG